MAEDRRPPASVNDEVIHPPRIGPDLQVDFSKNRVIYDDYSLGGSHRGVYSDGADSFTMTEVTPGSGVFSSLFNTTVPVTATASASGSGLMGGHASVWMNIANPTDTVRFQLEHEWKGALNTPARPGFTSGGEEWNRDGNVWKKTVTVTQNESMSVSGPPGGKRYAWFYSGNSFISHDVGAGVATGQFTHEARVDATKDVSVGTLSLSALAPTVTALTNYKEDATPM